ncbi:MAG: TIGR01777 family oxidoreductase, partial [Bacteriovorax sp.]
TEKLLNEGHEIHVLTRDKDKARSIFPDSKVTAFEWKNNLELPPVEAINGVNGVINLMGENIGAKKWTEEQKKKLVESRVDATKNLVTLIEQKLNRPLDFFITASAIGIYPINSKIVLDENSTTSNTFLASLCKKWEAASEGLSKTKRRVVVRTSVVLEKEDGALKKMLLPFKMGLGGPIGEGNQMMSWIHRDDMVNLYASAVRDERFVGVYNAAAPHPVSNFEFAKALGHALHRPTLIPTPASLIKLIFGEMSTVILDSQAVVSKRLPEVGFKFKYETIDAALNAIFKVKSAEEKSLLDQARPKTL